jgi:hypothetical protein
MFRSVPMKRLKILTLTAFVGIGLLAIGCGESGDTGGTTREAEPAASAPAEASAPATEPEATGEPSEAGADDEGAVKSKRARRKRPRFAPPVQGVANVEVLAPKTKVEGNEVVTRMQVRNVSRGSIELFTVSEFWYDEQSNALPGDTKRHQKRFLPGEVIEIELRTPKNPKQYQNQFQFSHANGDVEVQMVKSFPEPSTE